MSTELQETREHVRDFLRAPIPCNAVTWTLTGPKELRKKADKEKRKKDPIFKKKENATLAHRIEILDWHHKNGKNQTQTAKHFDKIYPNLMLQQPLISSWVKNEEKWRRDWAEAQASGRVGTMCWTIRPSYLVIAYIHITCLYFIYSFSALYIFSHFHILRTLKMYVSSISDRLHSYLLYS